MKWFATPCRPREQPCKLIFLDFDGVVIPYGEWLTRFDQPERPFKESCVKALNKVLENTGAYIVVSSTHRIGKRRVDLAERFEKNGIDHRRLLGSTPYSGSYGRHQRAEEIVAFLDAFPCEVESWAVIDDETSDLQPIIDRVVKTVRKDGLCTLDTYEIEELLTEGD